MTEDPSTASPTYLAELVGALDLKVAVMERVLLEVVRALPAEQQSAIAAVPHELVEHIQRTGNGIPNTVVEASNQDPERGLSNTLTAVVQRLVEALRR